MMICISYLYWADIAEGVPTLKQHHSLLRGVSVGGEQRTLITVICGQ